MSYELNDGVWEQYVDVMEDDGIEKTVAVPVHIVDVPLKFLFIEYEDLVCELSQKEVELLKLKEYLAVKSFEIEQETDFKELYGKNNADVRKHHIKQELGDVYDEVTGLELSINWIKSYIPLLKEVLKRKRHVKIFGE